MTAAVPLPPTGTLTPAATVALLVLACHAPAVLGQLAAACDAPRFRCYVHLDAREDPATYTGLWAWPAHVEFIGDRFPVYWGGFNMIRATEALVRRALGDMANRVFVLLSDDTLPLVRPDRLFAELMASPDRIDVGLARRNPRFLTRYRDFFFLDSPATSARPLAVEQRSIDPAALDALERLARLRERGKVPLREVWSGSQWWALSRPTLTAVTAELASDAWLRASFEFSAVPDEMAIQTLYANRLGLTARSFTGPMFADMSRAPAPFVYRSWDEVPTLGADKLFIRKIANEAAEPMARQLRSQWDAS